MAGVSLRASVVLWSLLGLGVSLTICRSLCSSLVLGRPPSCALRRLRLAGGVWDKVVYDFR